MTKLANLSLLSLVLPTATLGWNTDSRPKCFCTPSDACWPTTQDLDNLAAKLSSPQALISPHPTAYTCHDPHFDQQQCTLANVSASIPAGGNYPTDPVWVANQAGSMQGIEWESSIYGNASELACAFDSGQSAPCGQGAVPTVGIKVAGEQDFVEALNFALEHNLRVVVKSSGHDFLGRSTAPDALLIWTHEYNNATILDSFTPTGGSESFDQPMRIQAGVSWDQAANTSFAQNRIVVSGISAKGTVGAGGGWQVGGGHSALAPSYGLGVDNVIQFRVVVPPTCSDGKAQVIDVNEYTNSDLFWAMRGGGGPTFGIITEVIYKTYPDAQTLADVFAVTLVNDDQTYLKLLETFLNGVPELSDNHWGGYDFELNITSEDYSIYSFNVAYLRHNITNTTGEFDSLDTQNGTISSFIDKLTEVASASPGANITNSNILLPSWAAFYPYLTENSSQSDPSSMNPTMPGRKRDFASGGDEVRRTYDGYVEEHTRRHTMMKRMVRLERRQDQVGGSGATPGGASVSSESNQSSRLIPREVYSGEKAKRYAAWLAKQSVVPGNLVAGGAVSAPSPDAAGLNPAWRSALHSMVGFSPADAVDADINALMEIIGGDGGGVYINEVGFNEPNWPYAFWGDHYSKLEEIKEKYDPMYMLMSTWGVGAEKFDREVRCRT